MRPDILTREDLHDEFRTLASVTLVEVIRELSQALRNDVQQELRRCFATVTNANVTPDSAWCYDTELAFPKCPHFATQPLHGMAPPSPPPSPPGGNRLEKPPGFNLLMRSSFNIHSPRGSAAAPSGNRPRRGSNAGLRQQSPREVWQRQQSPGNDSLPGSVNGAPHITIEAWSSQHSDGSDLYSNDGIESPCARRSSRIGSMTQPRAKIVSTSGEHTAAFDEDRLGQAAGSKAVTTPRLSKDCDDDGASSRASIARLSNLKTFDTSQLSAASPRTIREIGIWHLYKGGRISGKQAVAYAVKSEYFDYTMGLFLISNAFCIGAQVDYMAGTQPNEPIPMSYRMVDGAFCVIFVAELLLRLSVHGMKFFTMLGWRWNLFDVIVVLFQVIDETAKLLFAGTAVQDTLDGLGVLRMLRLARILRLIRMVRLLPELKAMVLLISASMNAFMWTGALLLILIYCMAVYYTELATDIIQKDKVNQIDQDKIKDAYGSLANSILTLFQAISGGDDWRNFVDFFGSLGGLSHFANTTLFACYVAFATLVMLNLVTGVFVEGAQRLIKEERDAELVRQVRKLFGITDTDLSGEITWQEFEEQICNHSMDEFLSCVELQYAEAEVLFKLLDADHSGTIDAAEFLQGCMRLKGAARSVDLSALQYRFDEIVEIWSGDLQSLAGKVNTILERMNLINQTLGCTSEMDGIGTLV